jgi:predicted Zn-dependent protease with MMP-like domain
VTDEQFEQLVCEGIEAIPKRFLLRLKNVAIVVGDAPTREQLHANGIPEGGMLLGLYEGIPLIERGESYGGLVLPDKITIFKNSIIEEAGGDESRLRELVRDTVWHEIAHYFGYSDSEILLREDNGTNHSL